MRAKSGNKVKVHYTLKHNGEVIESSADVEPLEVKLGQGQMISGFENGIIGMQPGESKTISLSPAEAYGEREERKVFEFSKEKAPAGFDPKIGQIIRLHAIDGTSFPVTVVEIKESAFVMDANHPFAGKELVFDLQLVEIVE